MFLTSNLVTAQQVSEISLIPSSTKVNVGEEFTVTLSMDPTEAIGGWSLTFHFNQELAHATNITPGINWTSYFSIGEINNLAGTITEMQTWSTGPYQTADYILCTIRLQAVHAGICQLSIEQVKITNISFEEIPVSFTNTTINIVDTSGGDDSPSRTNRNPAADASNGEPYHGYVGESVTFDGSLSNDPDGDTITYLWDFGDGTKGFGKTTTHSYLENGTYVVILTVEDESGATHTDQTSALILQKNTPLKPTISGENNGTTNTTYSYSISSVDPDNDTIRYSIIWGDETSSITESDFLPNGTPFIANYTWATPGKFTMMATASDNETVSGPSTYAVYINAMDVGDFGYFIDTNGDGTYDRFFNESSHIETNLSMQHTVYLIDDDGDGVWDYTYTGAEGFTSYVKQEEKTPSFELVFVLCAIAISLLLWTKKKSV